MGSGDFLRLYDLFGMVEVWIGLISDAVSEYIVKRNEVC
jgi:hypothetical protein